MSKYTTELRLLIDSGYDLKLDDPETYPIWDEAYRPVLNKKIIDRYYFREIGQETPARFLHYLHSRLREIMPYYISLYETSVVLDGIDPLVSVDYSETLERETEGVNESGSTTSRTLETESGDETTTLTDTTQTLTDQTLSVDSTPARGMTSMDDLEDGIYATDAKHGKSNQTVDNDGTVTASGTSTGTSTESASMSSNDAVTSTENYIRRVFGNQSGRTAAELITSFRDAIIKIDTMILDDLNDLFMGVF